MNSDARINVVAGDSYTELYILDAFDADGDDITLTLNSGAPRGVTLQSNECKLSWNNVPSSASGVVEIVLSDGQASSTWVPEVKICQCQVNKLTDKAQALKIFVYLFFLLKLSQ